MTSVELRSGFPRVPHLPGSHAAPEDIHASPARVQRVLESPVWVYEKLDGVNVTFRRAPGHRVGVALKDEWRSALDGALARAIAIWAAQHEAALYGLVGKGAHLHGEWLWHRVTVRYRSLPAPFIAFSLRGPRGDFLPPDKAKERIERAGLTFVQPLFVGRLGSMRRLTSLVGRSAFADGAMEGVIVEEQGNRHQPWSKFVDAGYVHPTTGRLCGEKNRVRGFPS